MKAIILDFDTQSVVVVPLPSEAFETEEEAMEYLECLPWYDVNNCSTMLVKTDTCEVKQLMITSPQGDSEIVPLTTI